MFTKKASSPIKLISRGISPVSLSSGLSLLELIIALVILQIAITGFAQLFMGGLDLSRKARSIEMAQILAQNRMEELIRTIPSRLPADLSTTEPGEYRLLNERPGTFDDFAYTHSEDTEPFMWLAEVRPSPGNEKLVDVELHVYVARKRTRSRTASSPEEDFYLSEDRKRFTLVRLTGEDSVEITQGSEQLKVCSAVAVP